ncbi:XdhC family protein [Paracrocinitomix mangrovi]|uniref:XdhC family protein n=1 Tax=Paracrocinitomix mangrovi TaxID=2862509 RepID=UPI001C8DF1C4|nr:XdhC/CoxI family protein [Paracrocinitomix mangrovi]UKN00103.1 XdhC family protein [Paracrocinitomix mangrovi]
MNIWENIKSEIDQGNRIVLMYVLDAMGSSPGRQGFKMIVSDSGKLVGSIGGGFMEHKLVELCKQDLLKREFDPFIKKQVHQTNIPKDRSGMICSGEQWIAFFSIDQKDTGWIQKIISKEQSTLVLTPQGIQLSEELIKSQFKSKIEDENHWIVKEDLHVKPALHIVGGGHVGFAVSKLAHEVGFSIKIYDDRERLNTIEQNGCAEFIQIDDYEQLGNIIHSNSDDYVVLVSFGYRTDKMALKSLLNHNFKYLGMMGSKEKVKKIMEELVTEGVSKEKLANVYSPIGIDIHSKTPIEIAISIMAQIISVKNKD